MRRVFTLHVHNMDEHNLRISSYLKCKLNTWNGTWNGTLNGEEYLHHIYII